MAFNAAGVLPRLPFSRVDLKVGVRLILCIIFQAKQALQRLIDNLRAEQSVVLQSFCVVQQRVFTPVQVERLH